MSDIDQVNLRFLDGTVLQTFLSVMRLRKATLAAEEMGLSQPAISHALGRLRRLFGDPLFLRKSHGLEPTALARELEPKIRRIVRLMSETLHEPKEFDPASSDMTARIAAYDYELATILPQLISRTSQFHTNIRVETLTLSSSDALDGLVNNRIDLALGFFETLPIGQSTAPFNTRTCMWKTMWLWAGAAIPFSAASFRWSDTRHHCTCWFSPEASPKASLTMP